ncbi:MAG TPA: GxxExxY protein, partial [Anaerolineales bacterium]|nr:GxxExxY protein [Anaerolineales bacterium]
RQADLAHVRVLLMCYIVLTKTKFVEFAANTLGMAMTEILYKELSFAVIGAAMEVHRILGPGFLESVYQAALEKELVLRRIPFCHQVELPVTYKGDLIGVYKADLVIDGKMIIEIKGPSRLNASHQAQALHYLAATGLQLAILINFGMSSLEFRRVVKSESKNLQ